MSSLSPALSERSGNRLRLWALAIVLFSCFYGLGTAGIFDRDEGLYSTASRQMLESGDWVVPRVGAETRYAKPPLIYWLQAPCIALLGATPFAVRLPSALATLLTSIVLWFWARRRGQEVVGLLAAVLYSLCPLTIALSRQAITDSLLTLCFTLTMIGFIEGYRGQRQAYLLMALGAAGATMTKGVIGPLLPLAVFGLWLVVRRDDRELRRVPWLAAAGLYFLLVAPWHMVMWRVNGNEFFREYLLHNHVQRFTGTAWGHVQPFYFYLPVLIVGMFPWSTFAPVVWWQALHGGRRHQCERENLNCAWAMWALWAAVVIGFFSLSRSKLPHYALPALPALSLLIAARLCTIGVVSEDKNTRDLKLQRFERVFIVGISLLFTVLMIGVGALGWQWHAATITPIVFGKIIPHRTVQPIVMITPLLLMMGVVLGGFGVLVAAQWKYVRRVVAAAIGLGLALIVLLTHLALRPWSAYAIEPLHDLGQQTVPALDRGESLVIYALEPRRTSLRFVIGHTSQVTETNDAEVLQRVFTQHQHGYILTEQGTHLPSLAVPVQREAQAKEWVLWRCG